MAESVQSPLRSILSWRLLTWLFDFDWLINWLIDWSIDWLIDWLIYWLIASDLLSQLLAWGPAQIFSHQNFQPKVKINIDASILFLNLLSIWHCKILPFCKLIVIFKYLLLTSAKPCHPELVKPPFYGKWISLISIFAQQDKFSEKIDLETVSPHWPLLWRWGRPRPMPEPNQLDLPKSDRRPELLLLLLFPLLSDRHMLRKLRIYCLANVVVIVVPAPERQAYVAEN